MEQPIEDVSRRTFIKAIALCVAGCYATAIGYPVYRYLTSPAEQAAMMGDVKEVFLKEANKIPVGSILMFLFGHRPGILIHHKDGTWNAFDAVCAHLGCTVGYLPDRDVIHCNCHGGEYDSRTGKNISGPPPHPLAKYVAKIQEDGISISRA